MDNKEIEAKDETEVCENNCQPCVKQVQESNSFPSIDTKDKIEIKDVSFDVATEEDTKNGQLSGSDESLNPTVKEVYEEKGSRFNGENSFKNRHQKLKDQNKRVEGHLSEAKSFKCHDCNFESNIKNNFEKHALTHRKKETKNQKKPDMEVVLTSLSSEMIAAYTQPRILKLTLTKLEEEKGLFSIKNLRKIKRGRTIVMNPRMYRLIDSKYSKIKAPRPKKKSKEPVTFPVILNCFHCSFIGKDEKELEEHDVNHKDLGLYRCKRCAFYTNDEMEFTEHHLEHVQGKHFKCSRCDYKSTIKASIRQHELSHRKTKMFKCTQCDYATNYKGNLRSHESGAHAQKKLHKCDKCDFAAQFKIYLELHKITHMEGEVLTCSFCHFTSDLKTDLRDHIVDEHYTVTSKRRRSNANYKEVHDISCDKCDFTTNSRSSFYQHKRRHLAVKEFKCSSCNYETHFRRDLMKHSKIVHKNSNPIASEQELSESLNIAYQEPEPLNFAYQQPETFNFPYQEPESLTPHLIESKPLNSVYMEPEPLTPHLIESKSLNSVYLEPKPLTPHLIETKPLNSVYLDPNPLTPDLIESQPWSQKSMYMKL